MEYRFEQGNFADARIVRTRVFMEEQGFANEFDSLDAHPATLHVTLYDAEGALAGCARTFPTPSTPTSPAAGCSAAWPCCPRRAATASARRCWPSPSASHANPGPRRCTCMPSAA